MIDEGKPAAGQRLRFLAAAAEQEGIAALQPDDPAAAARQTDQQGVDLRLRHMMVARDLAGEDPHGSGRDQRQDRLGDKLVVDNHIGRLQDAQRLQRQQLRVTRAGADEVDRMDCFGQSTCSLVRRLLRRPPFASLRVLSEARRLRKAAAKIRVPHRLPPGSLASPQEMLGFPPRAAILHDRHTAIGLYRLCGKGSGAVVSGEDRKDSEAGG